MRCEEGSQQTKVPKSKKKSVTAQLENYGIELPVPVKTVVSLGVLSVPFVTPVLFLAVFLASRLTRLLSKFLVSVQPMLA